MKPLSGLFLFVLCLLAACTTVKEKQAVAEDKTHYNSLIRNAEISDGLRTGNFDIYYSWKIDTFNLLKVKKEVCDSTLGIKMRMHGHDDIFYFTNDKDFEFAFPFHLEEAFFYYRGEEGGRDIVRAASDDYAIHQICYQKIHSEESRRQLDMALEYATYWLNLRSFQNVKRFMLLFADSLIGLKQLSEKDTSFVNQALKRQIQFDLKYNIKQDIYTDSLKSRVKRIVAELKHNSNPTNSYYYYMPEFGTRVFWKFTISQMNAPNINGRTYSVIYSLSVEFLNGEYSPPFISDHF